MRATTGTERFKNNLVDLVMRECRRRKVGRWIVLSEVVNTMNRLRDDQRYEWSFQPKPQHWSKIMSFEGTDCPCGDKKEHDTMLCSACLDAFKHHHAMSTFLNGHEEVQFRRYAATILLSLARGRKRNLDNTSREAR